MFPSRSKLSSSSRLIKDALLTAESESSSHEEAAKNFDTLLFGLGYISIPRKSRKRSIFSDSPDMGQEPLKHMSYGDRFIPNRSWGDDPASTFELGIGLNGLNPIKKRYALSLLGISLDEYKTMRVLHFSPPLQAMPRSEIEYTTSLMKEQSRRYLHKNFSYNNYKILDAPEMLDDFYTNTLCWSSEESIILALGHKVYHAKGLSVSHNQEPEISSSVDIEGCSAHSVTSMSASQSATGWSDGRMRVYSTVGGQDIPYHYTASFIAGGAICSMTSIDENRLYCGDRVGQFRQVDTRTSQGCTAMVSHSNHSIASVAYDGINTVAYGSNDNKVSLWDIRYFSSKRPIAIYTEYEACVKGLAFQPGSGKYLVSGGGIACKRLCVHDTKTHSLVYTVNTGSQVTGVHWFTSDPDYLVTSHGFSDCSLKLWSFSIDHLNLIKTYSISDDRVISMAGTKSTNQVAALTSNEALRFFAVNGINHIQDPRRSKQTSILSSFPLTIR